MGIIKISSENRIRNSINTLFDLAENQIGDDILNAFIPYGGIDELPKNDQSLTLAFEHEIYEMFSFLNEFDTQLIFYSGNYVNLTRIMLQLYCRIMENDYQYLIIYNLLNMLNNDS